MVVEGWMEVTFYVIRPFDPVLQSSAIDNMHTVCFVLTAVCSIRCTLR